MERQEIVNERYPHTVRILRIMPGKGSDDNPFADVNMPSENTETVLYEGRGRSFTDTTTEGNNNVDENKRKSSIPRRFDEWKEGMLPKDGDTIESFVGKSREIGIVKDIEPDNNRTIVYWSLRRV